MDIFLVLLALVIGYVIGITTHGVHIDIHNKDFDTPTDKEGKPVYNESLIKDLPPEVQKYYEENQGQNKW